MDVSHLNAAGAGIDLVAGDGDLSSPFWRDDVVGPPGTDYAVRRRSVGAVGAGSCRRLKSIVLEGRDLDASQYSSHKVHAGRLSTRTAFCGRRRGRAIQRRRRIGRRRLAGANGGNSRGRRSLRQRFFSTFAGFAADNNLTRKAAPCLIR